MDTTRRTFLREPFSGLSHLLGAVLSVAALVTLLILAHGNIRQAVSFSVYGASLILLYTASGVYHSLWAKPEHLDRLQRFDHVAIYLLIVGTYTPVCLISLHGTLGWILCGVECGLAAVGIACSLFWKGFPDWARVVIYIVMGWLVAAALIPLHHALPPAGFHWLVAGGVTYSLGVVVFATDRPHLWPGRFSAHDLWHIFVLAGSACHFILMAFYIAPAA
jgi:hemolysin III